MRIIIDIDNIEDTDKIIELVQSNFPNSSIKKESASENMLRAMSGVLKLQGDKRVMS